MLVYHSPVIDFYKTFCRSFQTMRILDNFVLFCLSCNFWIRTLAMSLLRWEEKLKNHFPLHFYLKNYRWLCLKVCRTCFPIYMLVYLCAFIDSQFHISKQNNGITWKIVCGRDNTGHVGTKKWFSAIGRVRRSKQLLLQPLHLNGFSVRVLHCI